MRLPQPVFFLSTLFFLWTSSAMADFGNRFVANKRLATALDSSEKKISYRFTCQDDMTLSSAAVYCVEALSSPAYLVSLQEDENGRPSGKSLASSSYTPRSQSWTTVPLDGISLLKDKAYHLVLEPDLMGGGFHPVERIGASNYSAFLSTDILNHLHPNDGNPDPNANTLIFEGNQWKELNQEPVYAIYGTGYHFQANPYDDPGIRPIYGKILQGQVLHFHCGYPIKALAFRVKKQGNPSAPLKYQILSHNYRAHKCHSLYSEVILTPDKAPSDFQWVTAGGIPSEVATFPAECYYFVLQTDSGRAMKNSPGCEDCYVISDVGNSGGLSRSMDLGFDGGPHLSRATSSTDGGSPTGWVDEFERDANVAAVGPVCPSPGSRQFDPLPTPIPLANERRYDP